MEKSQDSTKGPGISQYDPGPEKQVIDIVKKKVPEYEIFYFNGHLKVPTKVHELSQVHEYEKVHESNYRSYEKVRGYGPKYYQPNFISREQYEIVKEERQREKLKETGSKIKPKDTEIGETSDKTENIRQRKEAEVHVSVYEHAYKEYEISTYECQPYDLSRHDDFLDRKLESYMDRKIDNISKSPHEYILTDDNFCPFKFRDVFKKPQDINENEQAFLENVKFLNQYKRSNLKPVVHPTWIEVAPSKQSPPPQYSSLSISLPKPKKGTKTVNFKNVPDSIAFK